MAPLDPAAALPPRPGAAELVAASTVDGYFDAVPRPDADAVEIGPFTLFVSRTPWAYYARPSLRHPEAITQSDIDGLEKACRRHGVELTIEWVGQVHPELAAVAAGAGLEVSTYVLMAMGPQGLPLADGPLPAGVEVRVVGAEDPALLDARALANVAFDYGAGGPGGGGPGGAGPGRLGGAALGGGAGPGPAEREAARRRLSPDMVKHLGARARSGLTVTAVAEALTLGALSTGSYQPMGGVAEIVGVATLPCARGWGLAGAVTAVLAAHAHQHGARTLVLSAQNDQVSRVYQRVGFVRMGTTHAAERPRT